MKVIATFAGRNKDFRDWLTAGMPENVVFLAEHRKNRPTRGGRVKPSGPSIA
ncbi:MAG TPA: hypothetical protein GXX72_00995 [Clostridiaceae bacterium]|nr:hypothetical protein [Clostridiaceae bacterium]